MDASYKHDFTENLEAVARGVRRLEEVRDPELRDAIRAALGMPPENPVLDGPRRARMRRSVLALEPTGLRLSDRLVAVFTVLAFPAPYAVRALALCALLTGALAGAAVASADSLPDDALYPVKLAAEQLRVVLAVEPADRAAVELSLAEHRLSEAEQLAALGRESGALVATSAYAAHLASAAAELAQVDEVAPHAIALVVQLEARLQEQRLRAAETAQRLMSDPRTALAGVVLSTIASAPEGSGPTAAARIADSASAVSSRLSEVADDRASGGQPLAEALTEILGRPVSGPVGEEDLFGDGDAAPDDEPMFVVPPAVPTTAPQGPQRTAAPAAQSAPPVAPAARSTATGAPARTAAPSVTPARTQAPTAAIAGRTEPAATTRAATVRPSATARATARATAKPTTRPTATARATVDPSARIAAQKAKESAAKAKAALEKAKDAAKRTASPKATPKR